TAVEPFLRKICDREKRVINPVLPNLLSSLQSSEAFLEQSGTRTLDARLLATTDHFHDIRRALNETNFCSHSSAPSSAVDYVQASKKATNARDRDLLNSFIERFPALLSLTIPSVRPLPTGSSSTMKVDSQADVFDGIFDSEADYVEPSRSSSTEGRENQSPEKSAQKSGLSTAAPSPAPTPSVGSYNTTSTSFATCLSCLGDACDTLTGIDPLGRRSAFRGEGTWRDLTSLVFELYLQRLFDPDLRSLLLFTNSSDVLFIKILRLNLRPVRCPLSFRAQVVSYRDQQRPTCLADFMLPYGATASKCVFELLYIIYVNFCAKTTASQSLSSMDSMRQNPNVPLALGLRETSQDYLPSLRTIARLESDRRCCSAQRRYDLAVFSALPPYPSRLHETTRDAAVGIGPASIISRCSNIGTSSGQTFSV
ncbi:unnamed protein product, partial [Dibothriocephalus latus]